MPHFWRNYRSKSRHSLIFFVLFALVLFVLLGLTSPPRAHAATGINDQIPFQGKVVNTNGTNVADGNYTFVFKIYTVDTGGTAAWTETQTNIPVADGIFSVMLGAVTDLPGSVNFNTDNIYLGVEFNSDGEMSPRVRFGAVPQAFNALTVAGLTVTDSTGTLTIPDGVTLALSGSNNLTFTTGGATNVTLPTTGTLATLAGTEILTNKTIHSSGLTIQSTGWMGLGSGAGRIVWTDAATDTIEFSTANVGIGMTPTNALDVSGSIGASTSVLSPALDRSTAGALAIGNTTATSVTICNSASCDTLLLGNNADADTITIGDSLDGLTIASSTFNVSSGAVSGVTTLASNGDWTWSATTPTITISGTETLTITNGTDSFAINTSGSVVTFSDGTNGFSFDADTGPSYTGTARPTKSIILSPEYAGATLTTFYGAGTDTSVTGTMTADIETTSAKDQRTYYEWSSTQTSLHNYTVAVRITLPPDFAAWTTSNALQIQYVTESTSTANNTVSAYAYLSSNTTTAVASSTSNASGTAATWTTITIDDSTLDDGSAPEWDAAGEVVILYLRLSSKDDNYARLGDITLSYLAAY